MIKTGITRRIDPLGRIVVPREIVKSLSIKVQETMEVHIDESLGYIAIKKYVGPDISAKVLRKLDDLYRIVIPKPIRERMGIQAKTLFEVLLDEEGTGAIYFSIYKEGQCAICHSQKDLYKVKEKMTCDSCIAFIKNNF